MDNNHQPHSAAFFGDYRDFWWNRDFLELLVKRWGAEDVRSVLDVGCGVGHWGRIVASVLPSAESIVGVDREEKWIEEATKRTADDSRFRYQRGDAMPLPFEDNSFDLVTCQTVLIHVEKPVEALREMLRVTKPGGIIVAAEPNNRAGTMVWGSTSSNDNTIEDTVKHVRFHQICERGKIALGLGDTSLGDLLPGLFVEAGGKDIQVYLSDKTSAIFPPYNGREQQTLLAHQRSMTENEMFMWGREESERYFLAGGGTAEEFQEMWSVVTASDGSFEKAIASGTYHTGGGAMMYVVSGRKSL